MARKATDEQARLLRHLAKENAQLEWPCCNPVLLQMVDNGLAEVTYRWDEQWGGRMHHCAKIAITDAGRAALQASEHKTRGARL